LFFAEKKMKKNWVLYVVLHLTFFLSSAAEEGNKSTGVNATSPDVALVSYLLSRGFPFRELIKMRLLSEDELDINYNDLMDESIVNHGSEADTEKEKMKEEPAIPSSSLMNSTAWWHRFVSPDSQIAKFGLHVLSRFLETRQWLLQFASKSTPSQISAQILLENESKNDARAASSVDELRAILHEISSIESIKTRRRQQGEALVLLSQWRLFFDSEFLPLSAIFESVPQSLLNVSGIAGSEKSEVHSLKTIDDAIRCMAAGVSLMHDSLIEVYSTSEYTARMRMQDKQEEIRIKIEEKRIRESEAAITVSELFNEEGLNNENPLSVPPNEAQNMDLVQAITQWVSANPGKPWPSDELLQHLSLEFDLNSLGLDSTQAIFDFVKNQVEDHDDTTASETPPVVKPEDEFGNAYIFLNNRGEVWQPPINLYVNGPYLSPTADDVSSIGAELFVHTSLLPEHERKSFGIQGYLYEDGLTILSLLHLSRVVVRNSEETSDSNGALNVNNTVHHTLSLTNTTSSVFSLSSIQQKFIKSIESLVVKEETTFQRYASTNASTCILRLKNIPSYAKQANDDLNSDRARLDSANRVDVSKCPQVADASPIFSSDEEALNILSSLARRGIQVAQLAIGSKLADKMYSELAARGVYPSKDLVVHDEAEWVTVNQSISVQDFGEHSSSDQNEVQIDASGQIIDSTQRIEKTIESRVRVDRKADFELENLPSCLASMRLLLPLAILAANDNKAVSRAPDNLSPLWELHEDSMVSNLAATENLNVDFLRAQADAGDPDAALHMADLLAHGNAAAGMHQDNNRAFEWMSVAAQGGNTRAGVQRAIMMIDSIDDSNVHRNLTEAMEVLKAAAEKDDVEAMAALGFVYQTGRGAEKNLTLSMFYLKKAAANGMTQAHSNLAALYLTGDPADPSIANASAAREHLHEALTGAMFFNEMHLFAPAAYNLGLLELHGWDRSDGRGSCMRALPLLKSVAAIGPWIDDSAFSLSNAFSRASRGGRQNDESAALQYLLLSAIGVTDASDNAAFLIERGVLADNLDVASAFLDKVGLSELNEVPSAPQFDRENLLIVEGGSLFTTEFREYLVGLRFHETMVESNLSSHVFNSSHKEIARGLLNRKRLESLRHKVFDSYASYLAAPKYLAHVPGLFGRRPILQFVRTFGISQATSGLSRMSKEAEMEGSNVDSDDWMPLIFSQEEWKLHEKFEEENWNDLMEHELGDFHSHVYRQRALNWIRGKDSFRGMDWETALVEYLDYEALAAADNITMSRRKNESIEESLSRSCDGSSSNKEEKGEGAQQEEEEQWSLELNANMMAYSLYSSVVDNAHSMYRTGMCMAEIWEGVPQCSSVTGGEIARKMLEKSSETIYAHASYMLASAYDTGKLGKHSFQRNFSEAWRLLDQCLALDPLATFPVTVAKTGLVIKWISSLFMQQTTEDRNEPKADEKVSLLAGLWDCLVVWPNNTDVELRSTNESTKTFFVENPRSLSLSLDANADGNVDLEDIQEALELAQSARRDANGKRFMIGPFPGSYTERTTCSVVVRATVIGGVVGLVFAIFALTFLFLIRRV